jgi:hypothetical protein
LLLDCWGGGCTQAVGPTRFFPDLFILRGSELCRSASLNSSVVLGCSNTFLEASEKVVWVSSLHRFAFLDSLSRLVVRFHVPSTM